MQKQLKRQDDRITKVKRKIQALTDVTVSENILDPMGKAVEKNEKDIAELKNNTPLMKLLLQTWIIAQLH